METLRKASRSTRCLGASSLVGRLFHHASAGCTLLPEREFTSARLDRPKGGAETSLFTDASRNPTTSAPRSLARIGFRVLIGQAWVELRFLSCRAE